MTASDISLTFPHNNKFLHLSSSDTDRGTFHVFETNRAEVGLVALVRDPSSARVRLSEIVIAEDVPQQVRDMVRVSQHPDFPEVEISKTFSQKELSGEVPVSPPEVRSADFSAVGREATLFRKTLKQLERASNRGRHSGDRRVEVSRESVEFAQDTVEALEQLGFTASDAVRDLASAELQLPGSLNEYYVAVSGASREAEGRTTQVAAPTLSLQFEM